MSVSKAITGLREHEGITQKQLALELNISEQLVSHLERNRRNMQKETAERTLQLYDAPVYAMNIIREFSDGYTSPHLNGKAVEWHRLAVEEFAVTEVQEAVQILAEVSLVKPPKENELEELNRIEDVIGELLDAEMAIGNLKAILADEYQLSLKSLSKKRIPTWKAKGWIE